MTDPQLDRIESTVARLSASERAARRRRRRSLLFWLAAAAAVLLALLLIRCGGGFGLGSSGLSSGSSSSSTTAPTAAPTRCQLRVDATGITLAGAPTTIPAAVSACRATPGADILLTGSALQGTWDALRSALDAASIPSLVRGGGAPPPLDAGLPPVDAR